LGVPDGSGEDTSDGRESIQVAAAECRGGPGEWRAGGDRNRAGGRWIPRGGGPL